MCGLAGMVMTNGAAVDPLAVRRMADALFHRGPDDEGLYVNGSVGFSFRRLAILDLSPAGHQPMLSADGRYVVVYNGEIYNFIELREELESLGYRFRSSGDTEVLLASYMTWGRECLKKFNGMWAFLIYDTQRGVVFGSRDRFGVKPLFRYHNNGAVLFASEVKGIVASGYYTPGVNWQTAAQFLLEHRLDGSHETFFRDISHIAPGTCFELSRDGRWQEWRYWSLPEHPIIADDEAPSRFLALFDDAVRIRLRSDVPLGVALSGGMDSSSILCAIARRNGSAKNAQSAGLNAFSYMAPEFDESPYIHDVLEQTQARLHRVLIDSQHLIDTLAQCLWFHDEPVHSLNVTVGFATMRLAAQNGVKVMLGGQGADETIGGYFTYFQNYWASLLRAGGITQVRREIAAFVAIHGGNPQRLLTELLVRVAKSRLVNIAGMQSLVRWRHRVLLQKNSWFTKDLAEGLPAIEYQADQEFNTALQYSITRDPLPLHLRVEDRNSMAHSVEARLPFMDYRLVSFVWKLPAHWRMRGPWNKFILREAMRGQIPESVRVRRDKMGLPVPDQRWFKEGIRSCLLDLLGSRAMRERGIYEVKRILTDLERKETGPFPKWRAAFDIVQFELWSKQFCDTAAPQALWPRPLAKVTARLRKVMSLVISLLAEYWMVELLVV